MRKTPTIFDRDWDGNRGVVPKLLVRPGGAYATEKLDGTNVRLTVRNGGFVRLEKRRNPSKEQKKAGITEPWYTDSNSGDPADRYLWSAAAGMDFTYVPDGEWSAEAVGPKIQGNPLGLDEHRLFFFDRERIPPAVCVPLLDGVPELDGSEQAYFDDLRDYLRSARSVINPAAPIEGIVWHGDTEWAKLKAKDFK